jgi:hypothetical protein
MVSPRYFAEPSKRPAEDALELAVAALRRSVANGGEDRVDLRRGDDALGCKGVEDRLELVSPTVRRRGDTELRLDGAHRVVIRHGSESREGRPTQQRRGQCCGAGCQKDLLTAERNVHVLLLGCATTTTDSLTSQFRPAYGFGLEA